MYLWSWSLPILFVLACGSPRAVPAPNAELHGPWSAAVAPFRIVGNVYYVGAKHISSYLVTTPEGHVLIDTGTREMEPVIRAGVEQLGFALRDIKVVLSSHAHFDHVGSHAALQRATGARVMVMRDDAPAVASGVDQSPLGDEGWQPARVDRILSDGDTVALGGTTLQAIAAPGHTPGCTVWTTRAHEPDKDYTVVFYGCVRPNNGVQLIGNARFPHLVEQTLQTFRRMHTLQPDIYLMMHPEDRFTAAVERMIAGARPHPLDDPAAWPRLLAEAEAEFSGLVQSERDSQHRAR
jgi:metallo-beta-lactamase class B